MFVFMSFIMLFPWKVNFKYCKYESKLEIKPEFKMRKKRSKYFGFLCRVTEKDIFIYQLSNVFILSFVNNLLINI